MLTKITAFFAFLNSEDSDQAQGSISIEMACTVLLCEVMRADGDFAEQEQMQLREILLEQFSLTATEVSEIITLANDISAHSTDFYRFTSKINLHYSLEQRMNIVQLLWKIAYADGELAAIEEHIIRKIADLLHLRHSEYIQTKLASQP